MESQSKRESSRNAVIVLRGRYPDAPQRTLARQIKYRQFPESTDPLSPYMIANLAVHEPLATIYGRIRRYDRAVAGTPAI